jgi:hypothetical protein
MQKLKINFHGESWTLKKFECTADEYEKCLHVAAKMKLSLKEALLNPFFYYNLQLPRIPSLGNLPGKKITGLINTPKNQIEIALDGKRISKFHFDDLLLLFPLYDVERIAIQEELSPGIYIEQKAIGFIASHEITISNYNPDDIQFKLSELKNKYLLQNITYNEVQFKLRNKESTINYQNSFEIVK